MPETPFSLELAGQTLRGTLHLPTSKGPQRGAEPSGPIQGQSGAGPFPATLWLPGFGGTRGEAHRLFVDGARELASRGIASLRIDYRGAGESDGDILDMTIESQVADARAALAALRAMPELDATRLSVLGYSLGAAIASRLHAEAGLAAMTLWAPVVFPVPIFARMGLYSAHPEIARQGWIDAGGRRIGRAFLAELSALDPLGELSQWRHPLLVLYGAADSIATTENAEALLEEIAQAEGECRADANHIFGSYKDRMWLLTRTADWLANQLAGVPAG